MVEKSIKVRIAKNKIFKFIVYLLSFLTLAPLFLILFFVFQKGLRVINWNFLTQLPKPVGVEGGGIFNAIIGTLFLIIIASCIAVPLGMTAGIYLSEYRRTKLSYITRITVDILYGTPSIVIGIIAYLWIVVPMRKFSALSGGIALGLMMLPIVVRNTEEVLKLIPDYLKEASLSLGVPHYKTILKVVVPAGIPGIISGILLGISRIAGETAPLLFTAFGNPFLTFNIMKPMNSLPLLIFNYAMSPFEEWQTIAWGASVILIIIVLAGNIISRLVVAKWKVQF
jgi:phosphate transport system permease protein